MWLPGALTLAAARPSSRVLQVVPAASPSTNRKYWQSSDAAHDASQSEAVPLEPTSDRAAADMTISS
jgi:hypothetical protein